jgi:hypothetical protein
MIEEYILNVNNWIVLLSNVTVFIVIQTMFFIFYASNIVGNTLEDKAGYVKTYIQANGWEDELESLINSNNIKEMKSRAEEKKTERFNQNMKSSLMYFAPIVATLLLIIAFLFIYSILTRSFNIKTVVSTVIVFHVYLTELLLFFFVVKPYKYITDSYLPEFFLNKFRKDGCKITR